MKIPMSRWEFSGRGLGGGNEFWHHFGFCWRGVFLLGGKDGFLMNFHEFSIDIHGFLDGFLDEFSPKHPKHRN